MAGADRRRTEPHAKRAFPTTAALGIPEMPTMSGLPSLRSPEVFAVSSVAATPPPATPAPRRPPHSLPRVRLERGALDEAAPASSHI
ncbi:MAG TPA: hypothetical protein VGR88_09420 [Ktedonobacterales bacterium]|nr:hypothetical protein [Ktedonobacterales bacterium]